MSSSALKGSDNNLYIPVVNARTGKKEYKNPVDLMESVVTLQSEWNSPENKIAAFDRDRQPRMGINRDDVDYIFPNNQAAFNNLSNLVPMIGSVKGQRVAMAARMLTQALPIEAAEAPLVQSKIPGTEDESYEDRVGRFATVNSKVDGMVRKITDREIVIDTADGQKKYPLVQNMATNRKTYISNTPVVQPGQQIKAGQVLAKSNYTDDTGALAQGLNARAVVMPWRGSNTMDGIVISQSFANRMKSQHAYQHRIDWSDNIKQGKKTFIGAFPSAYDKEQLETIEDNGVVKIGTTVNQGDPLVLKADVNSKPVDRIHRKGATSLMNSALEWDHEDPGVVVDVHNDKNSVNVVVSSLQPMKVADKLANRYGAKGVINEIVPDDQMPITPDGPAEVIYSPIGNIGRVNYAMLHEHVLGRIAKKLGKPIKVEAFNPDNSDTAAWVMRLAKEHNISPREILTDPETGKQLTGLNGKGVGFGYSYVQKLHHSAEGKSSERSFGRYTADEQPACLQAGSQVLTRDGLFFIETLVDKRVDVWTGFNWASAVGVCKGQHQLAEIELENGTVIRCDTKHKLKNEMDEWVDFEFLRVGQLVSVSS
jgi:DNA-directed RNA polymerase subunit beta